jgi:translation initiation factor 2 subunit 2
MLVDYLEDYEKLLDNARKSLPEKTLSDERFEPPVAQVQLQGTKTTIRNFDVICQKLRRDPKVISKYLSSGLAVPTSIEGNKLVLHGKIYDKLINERLSNFIKHYVICPECKRPDTKIAEGEMGYKFLSCEACGARSPVKQL